MIQRPLLLLCCALPCLAQGEPPAELLTPEARAGLADALPRPLEALTHYAIDQALDDARGLLRGQVTVSFTHPGAEPLAALPLALHPNALADLGGAGQTRGPRGRRGREALDGPAVTWVQLRLPGRAALRGSPWPRRPGPGPRALPRLRCSPTVNDPFAQAQGSLGSVADRAADYGLLGKGDGILTLAGGLPCGPALDRRHFDPGRRAGRRPLVPTTCALRRVRTVFLAGLTVVTNLLDEAPCPGQDAGSWSRAAGRWSSRPGPDRGRDSPGHAPGRRDPGACSGPRDRAMGESARWRSLPTRSRASPAASAPYPYREPEAAAPFAGRGAGGVEFSG
ncbi:MAG: hypothetical protein R3F62_02875 [Planctomycetota bacterium]